MEKFYKASLCTEDELESGKYRYQKAKGKIKSSPAWDRDRDGFFRPTAEGPVRHYGLLCGALGATPVNREVDIEYWIEELAKEAYEHDIQGLMCRIRHTEYRFLYKFAAMDERNETDERAKEMESGHGESAVSFKAENKRFKDTISGDRGKLLDALTWKYKWIQLYKKPCYLFALHTIEDLRDWNSVKRLFKELPEAEQKFIMASGASYDPDKMTCIFEGEAKDEDEKMLRHRAGIYWREHERHMERERFREEFIHSYNRLPEANRRLMNTMYEMAWETIFHYKYGKAYGHIPAPCYDREDTGEEKTEGGDT